MQALYQCHSPSGRRLTADGEEAKHPIGRKMAGIVAQVGDNDGQNDGTGLEPTWKRPELRGLRVGNEMKNDVDESNCAIQGVREAEGRVEQ